MGETSVAGDREFCLIETPVEPRDGLVVASILLVTIVAGLLLAAFPLGFLDGTSDFWLNPTGDRAEHVIGSRYFLADIWRWPLLYVPALGVPDGVNIGLTDSVPIAAIIAKLLGCGTERSYLPIWQSFCYLAQGISGAWALHALGVRRVAPLVLGGLLLVFTPCLIYRFGHAALNGHFVVLSAITLHVRAIRGGSLALYSPLLGVALFIHIYLFAMVGAVFLASLLHMLWTNRLTVVGAFAYCGANAMAVLLLMWVGGYLALGPIPMKAYGSYPFNLAAPFLPGPSGVFGLANLPPGVEFESFAWLGAGFVLTIGVALALWWRRLKTLAAAHVPTCLTFGLVILFATTYDVRFGPWQMLGLGSDVARRAVLEHVSLRHVLDAGDYVRLGLYGTLLLGLASLAFMRIRHCRRLLIFLGICGGGVALVCLVRPMAIVFFISNFQGSARFIWVPLYLVTLLAIAAVSHQLRPSITAGLLTVALTLQVADTAPLWQLLRHEASVPAPTWLDEAAFGDAIKRANMVMVVPSYLCAYAEPLDLPERDALIDRVVAVQLQASRWVKPITSIRHSRQSATDSLMLRETCEVLRQAAMSRAGEPGLLLLIPGTAPAEAEVRRQLADRPGCRHTPAGLLCEGSDLTPPR